MGIAIFTDAQTGDDVYVDTNKSVIRGILLRDKATTIVRHIPDKANGVTTEMVAVREDFWHVIDTLVLARLRD